MNIKAALVSSIVENQKSFVPSRDTQRKVATRPASPYNLDGLYFEHAIPFSLLCILYHHDTPGLKDLL